MNVLMLAALLLAQSLPASFTTVRDVPLPGDTSRFDYVTLDATSHRLFIAHLGGGRVPVYDIGAGAIIGEVQNVPGVHGMLAVPELGRVYASATDTNQVAVIDPQSLSGVATIPGGEYGTASPMTPTSESCTFQTKEGAPTSSSIRPPTRS